MKRFADILEKIQLAVGTIFLSIFFLVIIIQIVTRHMGISIIWTQEVANNAFIWAVFMGASAMINRGDHFKFDFLERKLKGKPNTILQIINDTILLAFNGAVLLYGIQVVQKFWNYNWASLPQIKMGYVWLSIPVMAATMVVYLVIRIIDNIINFSKKEVI